MYPEHIVIAGASGGIGSALLDEAARRWPNATIHAVARRLIQVSHSKVIAYCHDLTQQSECEAFAHSLSEHTSKIHLAVYAIGTLNGTGQRPEKSLNEVNEATLSETFRINVTGAVCLARALKPFFRHREDSRFLFLSAKVGSISDNKTGGWYSYRISKAALNMAVKNLAFEFSRSSSPAILTAVHPGTTLTDFSREHVQAWPEGKVAEPKVTAERLWNLAEMLDEQHSGQFVHWDGKEIGY